MNILLVEDIPSIRELIVYLLEKDGYNVETANNGLEAIEVIKTKSFNIILMDIQMPEMDGITATKIIRNHSSIPIIALTSDDTKNICLEAGMNGYIKKPISKDILMKSILKYI